jgi:hypothetical protein
MACMSECLNLDKIISDKKRGTVPSNISILTYFDWPAIFASIFSRTRLVLNRKKEHPCFFHIKCVFTKQSFKYFFWIHWYFQSIVLKFDDTGLKQGRIVENSITQAYIQMIRWVHRTEDGRHV